MKKILALFLTVALLIPCCSSFAYAASTTKTVSSLHFTLDTSFLSAGVDTSEIDNGNVELKWNSSQDTTTYPGLSVSVTDCYCTNSQRILKVGDTVTIKYSIDVAGSTTSGLDYIVSSNTNIGITADSSSTGPKKNSTSKSRTSSTSMTVTVTTNAITGQYSEPIELKWQGDTLGQAKWSAPEDGNCAGYYDVRLKRNDSTVYTYAEYNATSFNFYPWMTKEGDYTFEVRSIAAAKGSKNSEWVQSETQYVAKEKVSDGSGQGSGGSGSGTTSVGWKQVNGIWYYQFPDGSIKKNGWEKISNKWYYFDATGAMKTGWITVGNETYYLDAQNGDMKTGWVKTSDGQWYYLTPAGHSGTEGAMVKSNWVDYNNRRYYMAASGAMCTGWTKIGNDYYYFFPEGDQKGAMATSQRIDSFWVDASGRWIKGQ